MVIHNINNLVCMELVSDKSIKGNEYKAIFLSIYDKDKKLITRHLLKFITNNQYDNILSLLQK